MGGSHRGLRGGHPHPAEWAGAGEIGARIAELVALHLDPPRLARRARTLDPRGGDPRLACHVVGHDGAPP